jgi:hypothetical protein
MPQRAVFRPMRCANCDRLEESGNEMDWRCRNQHRVGIEPDSVNQQRVHG